MRQRYRVAVAGLAAALIVASACGGTSGSSTSGTAVTSPGSESGVGTSTSAAPDSSPVSTDVPTDNTAAVAAFMTAPRIFVNPVVDPGVSTTVEITPDGGTVSLELDTGVTVTLKMPAGALKEPTSITLSKVVSLTAGGTPAFGVELFPPGLLFPVASTPTLTITGAPTGLATWLANSDGVAEPPSSSVGADGSIEIAIPHFSSAGAASPDSVPQFPLTPGEMLYQQIAKLLAEKVARLEAGLDTADLDRQIEKLLDRIEKEWVNPLFDFAAENCGVANGVTEWLRLQRARQLVGIERSDSNASGNRALAHEADCARRDCKNGKDTAAGLFLYVLKTNMAGVLDAFSDATESAMSEEYRSVFQGCLLLRFSLRMHAEQTYEAAKLTLAEDARADGIVRKDSAKGNPTVLPLTIVNRGLVKLSELIGSGMVEGFGILLAGVDLKNQQDCSLAMPVAGAVQVKVTLQPTSDPKAFPVPTVDLTPFAPPEELVCKVGENTSYLPELLLAGQAFHKQLKISPEAFTHEFEAGTSSQTGSWSYTETSSLPFGGGVTGKGSIDMRLSPVTEVNPAETPSVSTGGMTNLATYLMQLMSSG